MRKSVAVSLLLLAVAAVPGRGDTGPSEPDSLLLSGGRRRVDLCPPADSDTIRLPDQYIILNSERVSLAGRVLKSGSDYRIDYNRGFLIFPAGDRDTAAVEISYLPSFRLDSSDPVPRGAPLAEAAPEIDPPRQPSLPLRRGPLSNPFSSFINVDGHKSLAIDAGSGGRFAVDQSMRLDLSGGLGGGMEIEAALSDQSMPLSPEGSTRELRELDRVRIEIRGERFNSTLGDFSLSSDRLSLTGFNRRLLGAKLAVGDRDRGFSLVTGQNAGRYKSIGFSGLEGMQGPYYLAGGDLGAGGGSDRVKPGSEQVYLDGVLLARGDDADYLVDYENGSVEFTAVHPITRDSRIVVEYELIQGDFERGFYGGEGSYRLAGGRVKLNTAVYLDRDNPANPLGGAIAGLAGGGNGGEGSVPDDQSIYSAVAVGEGGDYDSLRTADGELYFIYRGPGEGRFRVEFHYVGTGRGEYEPAVAVHGPYYSYRGPGEGDYTPRRQFSPPESHSLAGIGLEYEPAPGMALSLETAASRLNRDMGAENESPESGGAMDLSGRIHRDGVRLLGLDAGRLELGLNYRSFGRSFRPLGRLNSVDYRQEWTVDDRPDTLSLAAETADRDELGLTASLEPLEDLSVSGRFGRRNFNDGSTGDLSQIGVGYGTEAGLSTDIISRRLIRRGGTGPGGNRWFNRATLGYPLSLVRPSLEVETGGARFDNAPGDNIGRDYRLIRLGARSIGGGPLRSSIRLDLRDNRRLQPAPVDTSRVIGGEATLDYGGSTPVSASVRLAHRRTEYLEGGAGGPERYDWADLHLSYHPRSTPLTVKLLYQIKNSLSPNWVAAYHKAGYGQGGYSYDSDAGQYYTDPDGQYRLVRMLAPGQVPHLGLRASLGVGFTPPLPESVRRMGGGGDVLRVNSRVDLVEETQEENRLSIYLLDLNRFQNDRTTLYGRIGFSHDIDLLPEHPRARLRLRIRTYDLENNARAGLHEETDSREVDLSGQYRGTTRLTLEPSLTHRYRLETSTELGLKGRSVRDQAGLGFRHALDRETTITWRVDLGRELLAGPDNAIHRLRRYELSPGIVRLIGNAGRVSSEINWIRKSSLSAGLIQRYLLGEEGLGTTCRWNCRVEYGLTAHLIATVGYTGARRSGGSTIHYGRAEMKALF